MGWSLVRLWNVKRIQMREGESGRNQLQTQHHSPLESTHTHTHTHIQHTHTHTHTHSCVYAHRARHTGTHPYMKQALKPAALGNAFNLPQPSPSPDRA